WRSTLAPGVFNSLSIQFGAMEMERQEVIHELVTFDREFVKSSRHIIRAYFLPLRTRDSRAWLPGIPPDMARLFDWLEDIVNLHAAISRALAPLVVVWKEGMVVERVAGTLRGFVPQLEIYMPYLVKLESAKAALKWYVERDEGVFGEYLRMKAGEAPEADGEGALERLVREPSSRLDKYVELFQV
ncbi:Dbl homology domain-containing protein, partial [Ganoderma leucocontextum]